MGDDYPMPNLVKRYAPAIIAILVCWIYVGVLYWGIVTQLQGLFVYPLDDTYIHLALARNLALHHVWGIRPLQFASASSSPGWILLLAAMDLLFGTHLITPILLNLLFAAGVLVVADYGIRLFLPGVSTGFRIISLVTIVLFTPLPSLVLLGMEHVAQTFTIFLLVILGSDILATTPEIRVGKGKQVALVIAAFLAGCIRYEAVFAILPLCGLLLWRRRFGLAIVVGLCAAIMPLGFGLYSHHVSGFWLPFSVLAKAAFSHATGLDRVRHIPLKLFLALLLSLWLLNFRSVGFWHPVQLLISLTLMISFLHFLFAPVGWLMRYESYLIALFLLTSGVTLYRIHQAQSWGLWFRSLPWAYRGLVLALLVATPVLARRLFDRAWSEGTVEVQRAAIDRYTEHIQMARFVAQFYPQDTIVVNDIGAIAYYTSANMLDVAGLGSAEPVRALKDGHPMSANDVAAWASTQHATIAIVQGSGIFASKIPASWIHVDSWLIPRNVAYPDRTIDFYAIDAKDVLRLCHALRAFPLAPQDEEIPVKNECPASPS